MNLASSGIHFWLGDLVGTPTSIRHHYPAFANLGELMTSALRLFAVTGPLKSQKQAISQSLCSSNNAVRVQGDQNGLMNRNCAKTLRPNAPRIQAMVQDIILRQSGTIRDSRPPPHRTRLRTVFFMYDALSHSRRRRSRPRSGMHC